MWKKGRFKGLFFFIEICFVYVVDMDFWTIFALTIAIILIILIGFVLYHSHMFEIKHLFIQVYLRCDGYF